MRRMNCPRMLRLLLRCLLLMALVPLTAEARPIAPLEGLEALRKAFSGVSDFTAEITQEKRLSLMKRTMKMSGTVRFRKPDQFYLEIAPPYASRMLLRDSIIEQAAGTDGDRTRIVLPPEQGLKRWFTKLATPVTTLPDGVVIQADQSDGVYTLTIAPQGTGQVKELVIIFQPDGTIRRLVIAERNGDRATMTFRKVRRNIGLGDKDFRLD